MPRDASTGVYTPPSNSWNPAQPDTVISSADWNALRADMATALNHAPATTRALHPTTGQVQDGAFIWGGTAGGTADALTLTLTPAITAYVAGLTIRFRTGPAANSTSTPSLSVNGLAAQIITKYDGLSLASGDLPANAVVEVIHDGTGWRLLLTVQSQTEGNDGASTVTSATSLVLTNYSTRVQVVSMTADGQSVFLPDAKTLTMGGPRFYVRNAGNKTFALRPSNANQLLNGGFDSTAAWTLGTGWAISGGVATKTSGSAADIEQAFATTSGVAFRVTFTITNISGGTVRAVLKGGGPDVLGPPRNAPGTYTETLESAGNTEVAIRADASFDGSIDNVALTLMHPPLLASMPPNAIAECVLENNNTIQGKWHVIGKNTMSAAPMVDVNLPNTLTEPGRLLKLNQSIDLIFARNSSGHPHVLAVDHGAVPPVIGTPVLISAASAFVRRAFRLSDNKALIFIGSPLNNFYIISVSGTTCTLSSAANANDFPTVFFYERPLIARLGANDDLFVGISRVSTNILARAVDASGANPSAGSSVNISTTAPTAGISDISVFRVDNNRAAAFYIDDSGVPGSPFSIRAVVLTLTGTSIAVGTSAGINDVITDMFLGHGVVCQLSTTSYVWVYASGNNVQAVAITISGSSVTFGTPITVTTFPSAPEVRFSLGNAFNSTIFKLSENRVFAAFRRITPVEWRCVILTVNGLSISAGPIFYIHGQESPTFFSYNDEHTILVQGNLTNNGSTGNIIGLDHVSTSIVPSGSVNPPGVPKTNGPATMASLSNGFICIRYDIVGKSGSPELVSSRIELVAPSPNGAPKSFGHFDMPEVRWEDLDFPTEVATRRLAFVGRTHLQEGANPRIKLCIMEVVS